MLVRTGNLIHLSGRLAKKNGKLWCGNLGEEITTAEGKQAARSVAIELLATLQAAIGDLNDVRRIVKLLVFVNSGPHFTEAHMVANGASELFIEVFEERGAHARSALGVSQIPFGCCVEIEMVVETFVSESECDCEMHPTPRDVRPHTQSTGRTNGRDVRSIPNSSPKLSWR